MRIVLASESESRKRALEILGLKYEVQPSAIDERAIRDPDPVVLTRRLAEAKAWAVVRSLHGAEAAAAAPGGWASGRVSGEEPAVVWRATRWWRKSGGSLRSPAATRRQWLSCTSCRGARCGS